MCARLYPRTTMAGAHIRGSRPHLSARSCPHATRPHLPHRQLRAASNAHRKRNSLTLYLSSFPVNSDNAIGLDVSSVLERKVTRVFIPAIGFTHPRCGSSGFLPRVISQQLQ